MDQLVDSLISIQQRLDSCGVRSATIGALAVAVWGRGRTTNDVDLKLNMMSVTDISEPDLAE